MIYKTQCIEIPYFWFAKNFQKDCFYANHCQILALSYSLCKDGLDILCIYFFDVKSKTETAVEDSRGRLSSRPYT